MCFSYSKGETPGHIYINEHKTTLEGRKDTGLLWMLDSRYFKAMSSWMFFWHDTIQIKCQGSWKPRKPRGQTKRNPQKRPWDSSQNTRKDASQQDKNLQISILPQPQVSDKLWAQPPPSQASKGQMRNLDYTQDQNFYPPPSTLRVMSQKSEWRAKTVISNQK